MSSHGNLESLSNRGKSQKNNPLISKQKYLLIRGLAMLHFHLDTNLSAPRSPNRKHLRRLDHF